MHSENTEEMYSWLPVSLNNFCSTKKMSFNHRWTQINTDGRKTIQLNLIIPGFIKYNSKIQSAFICVHLWLQMSIFMLSGCPDKGHD